MKWSAMLSCLMSFVIAAACSLGAQSKKDNGCRTGGTAIADAYVLLNPMYSLFLGDLESYLAENIEHFQEDGDAILCAKALSTAFASSAITMFDPADEKRRRDSQDELNAKLGALGIAPDNSMQQPSPAMQYLAVSEQLSRLARGLPPATDGDFEPLNTATNDMEQMRIFAENLLRSMLQDPEVVSAFRQVDGMVREAAKAEHQMILNAANQIAAKPLKETR
jgi:hypothetical protein